jgi:protein-disulfide isomerase
MYRRFLVALLRRSILVLLLICLGCSAQSTAPDLEVRIERQVRSFYTVPADVNIKIGPRRPSEFPNYDALTVTFENPQKKQTYDFLLSKDSKTLIRMTKLDLSQDPYAEIMKKIDVRGRPTRGNTSAKVVAVNYDDFECPFCSRMHQTIFPELLKEYGDRVVFIYKDFPLAEIHPWAIHAAVDANCLAAQNPDAFWDFADYIHASQRVVNAEKNLDSQSNALDRIALQQGQKRNLDADKLQACIKAQDDSAVKASLKEAEALGVDATPTLFVNGEKLDGARSANDVRALLDRALQQAGLPVPAHPAQPTAVPPAPGK